MATTSLIDWRQRRLRTELNPYGDRYAVLECACYGRDFGDRSVTPPYKEVTEATIRELVDGFYARVRRDPTLGPIFAKAIADDAWPAHLEKMYAFWSSVMLTSGRYKGNPVSTHRKIAGVEPAMFGNWLDLFEATAADLFVPEITSRFTSAARRIAESLKLALFFRPSHSWPHDLRHRPPVVNRCA